MSLRGIVEEMTLGFSTVRTIIGKVNGTDRTTNKHRGRIEVDRQRLAVGNGRSGRRRAAQAGAAGARRRSGFTQGSEGTRPHFAVVTQAPCASPRIAGPEIVEMGSP
jgi:hypothetical protein